jgi:hypothetical protein
VNPTGRKLEIYHLFRFKSRPDVGIGRTLLTVTMIPTCIGRGAAGSVTLTPGSTPMTRYYTIGSSPTSF